MESKELIATLEKRWQEFKMPIKQQHDNKKISYKEKQRLKKEKKEINKIKQKLNSWDSYTRV